MLLAQQREWYHGCPVKAIYRLSSLKVFALKDESLFVYLPFGSRLALSVTAYAVPPLPK